MGITIHYRGTIDDVAQVETMEDRLLDLVFSLGGRATIWRSYGEESCQRMVRGLMIEMEPGQETCSLLISPEGHLTPLFAIEEAEKMAFNEPPYCFVKTQFGTPLGHVALVHLLDALNKRYCSNLEVEDEGEYYETRDFNRLKQKMQFLDTAIRSTADGIRHHSLNDEAAEDPNIVAARIERIASLVQQRLLVEPCEPDLSDIQGDEKSGDQWHEASLEEEVQTFARLRRQSDLRSERMARRISEATESGLSVEEALGLAMQAEGLSIADPEKADPQKVESNDQAFDESVPEEPWLKSLPTHPFDENSQQFLGEEHPIVEQARMFLEAAMNLAKDESHQSSFVSILTRASLEIVGGLVQATSGEDRSDITDRALTITQLKRALTGHGFARGAIFGLRDGNAISEVQANELHAQLESILTSIHTLAERAWTAE